MIGILGYINKIDLICYCLTADTLQPSAWIFLFSHFVAAQDVLPTQHVSVRRPGNETQQLSIFVVRSGTAGTNPTGSTFNLNSL